MNRLDLIRVSFFSFLVYFALVRTPVTMGADQLSMVFTDSSLRSVLNEVMSHYPIFFIYNDYLIQDKKISCNLSGLSENEMITKIGKLTGLELKKVSGNTYVLYQSHDKPTIAMMHHEMDEQNSIIINTDIIPPRIPPNNKPIYPKDAISKGIQGRVQLILFIDSAGEVKTVHMKESSGSEILDKASKEYAWKLKFEPTFQNDKPISIWKVLSLNYQLTSIDTGYVQPIDSIRNE
ncbi:TonB family protein [candidate division KSB1 bacterium]|nr:TonB family protein [candidate division KSB1 bacterium]